MRLIMTTVVLALLAGPGVAGPIERACLKSDRSNGNRSVCACIQEMADRWLDRRDQRLAAEFFRDPQKAQEVRASDTPADDAFWDRYTSFGSSAAAACQRYAG